MLDSVKHTFSKKSCVEPILLKYELEAQLLSEQAGNANLCSTIIELKLAKEESEQVRLKFLVHMQKNAEATRRVKEVARRGSCPP